MGKWDKPQEVSDVLLAFPANVCGTLLPIWEDIPEEFTKRWHRTEGWNGFVSKMFNKGGKWPEVKEGIDGEMACRHLGACLRSYEPKQENKIAGVAYLMSLWCVMP